VRKRRPAPWIPPCRPSIAPLGPRALRVRGFQVVCPAVCATRGVEPH
jgi:hypothetical protein